MPKMKTRSAAKKRFKITGGGKVKRGTAYRSKVKPVAGYKVDRLLIESDRYGSDVRGPLSEPARVRRDGHIKICGQTDAG